MKTAKKTTSTSTKKAVSTKANSVAQTKTPDHKMAAANDTQPETLTAAANVTPANAAVALNQKDALKPEVAAKLEEQAAKAPKKEKAPKEEFLVKLRSKGDLLAALKAGGILYLENGLWRLDPGREDKKVHRVSKRRAVAFRAAELILPTTKDTRDHANAYVLNLAKASETEAKKSTASAPAPADTQAVTK